MNRWHKYTLLSFLFAGIFVFCSMVGMNFILQSREKQLLTETGNAVVESPVRAWQTWETDENGDDTTYTLTVKEVRNAIDRWNNRIGEVIHDPVEGQISMEQAIEEGKEWLVSMIKNEGAEAISGLESERYTVSAVLGLGKEEETVQRQVEPYYSFWTIHFAGQTMNATVYINAVTGKVWGAEITLYEDIPNEVPIESIYLFAELTGVEKTDLEEPEVSADGNGAVMALNEGIEVQMDFSVVKLDEKSIVDYSQSGIFRETYAVISYKLVAN